MQRTFERTAGSKISCSSERFGRIYYILAPIANCVLPHFAPISDLRDGVGCRIL